MADDRTPPLADFVVPIASGLEPAPPDAGRLSKDRAEQLDGQLRDLEAARRRAWFEIRNYLIGDVRA